MIRGSLQNNWSLSLLSIKVIFSFPSQFWGHKMNFLLPCFLTESTKCNLTFFLDDKSCLIEPGPWAFQEWKVVCPCDEWPRLFCLLVYVFAFWNSVPCHCLSPLALVSVPSLTVLPSLLSVLSRYSLELSLMERINSPKWRVLLFSNIPVPRATIFSLCYVKKVGFVLQKSFLCAFFVWLEGLGVVL